MPSDEENYRNMDQEQFDRRRAEDEARQDALLDQIHGGVVGLKNQAHAINGEVVEQNIMIDDISNRMDNATRDISREEQAAREVNARKNKARVYTLTCKLYGVIIVLVVILIVVLVVPGSKYKMRHTHTHTQPREQLFYHAIVAMAAVTASPTTMQWSEKDATPAVCTALSDESSSSSSRGTPRVPLGSAGATVPTPPGTLPLAVPFALALAVQLATSFGFVGILDASDGLLSPSAMSVAGLLSVHVQHGSPSSWPFV
ncbi:hypothetical protein PsorP6_015638 [Peronosclerospora sorghi]|uniref:Uncharacterized protein n=1 Tax=Peronosclerospora sorghi TaxID=230839 RepID=A0ACC0WMR0_9STRA|nr:hypothetical protein PsorP6_015638 [Peronosclerospora sorghi]